MHLSHYIYFKQRLAYVHYSDQQELWVFNTTHEIAILFVKMNGLNLFYLHF